MNITASKFNIPSFSGKNETPLWNSNNTTCENPQYGYDVVAFAKPHANNAQESVSSVLKKARTESAPRFSFAEQVQLAKEIKKFRSTTPSVKILKELLNMKYPSGEGLSVSDIASFFSIMNGTTIPQISATLALIEHYLQENYVRDSEELDNILFLPLENNPDLIVHLGNSNYALKKLPKEERTALMHWTMDVVENSDYKYNSYFPQILKATAQDKSVINRILYDAAKECNETEFKQLLDSLTPGKIKQINQESITLSSAEKEHDYISSYIELFKS